MAWHFIMALGTMTIIAQRSGGTTCRPPGRTCLPLIAGNLPAAFARRITALLMAAVRVWPPAAPGVYLPLIGRPVVGGCAARRMSLATRACCFRRRYWRWRRRRARGRWRDTMTLLLPFVPLMIQRWTGCCCWRCASLPARLLQHLIYLLRRVIGRLGIGRGRRAF